MAFPLLGSVVLFMAGTFRQGLYIGGQGSLLHTPTRGAVECGAWSLGFRPAVWDASGHGIAYGCSNSDPHARDSSSGSVGIARVVGSAYGYHGWVASMPAAHKCVVFLDVLQVSSQRDPRKVLTAVL